MIFKNLGYLYLLLSSVIYGLYGLFSRNTGAFPPFTQSFIKFSLIFLIIAVAFLFKKIKWVSVEKQDIKWFLLWILPCSFQPILTFIAFNHMPMGTAYFLIYSTMIMGGILSGKIVFNEKLDIKKIISLFLVFVGLFVIYRSDISLINNIYTFFALLSGLTIGLWNTLSKKVSHKYPEFQMILLDSISAIIIGIIGSIVLSESMPSLTNPSPWFWIFLFAVANILASLLLIKGFKSVEAQKGSLILPSEIVFASIFGFLIFKESLPFYVYVGGALILLASIIPYLFDKNTFRSQVSDTNH